MQPHKNKKKKLRPISQYDRSLSFIAKQLCETLEVCNAGGEGTALPEDKRAI
jgi:hypothetical protein